MRVLLQEEMGLALGSVIDGSHDGEYDKRDKGAGG